MALGDSGGTWTGGTFTVSSGTISHGFQMTGVTPPPAPPAPNDLICIAAGHAMISDEPLIINDEFVTFCERCGERFIFKQIPGGALYLRAKTLLTLLAEGQFDESVLGGFLTLKKELSEERESLELVQAILDQAAELVRVRGGLDSDAS